MKSHNQPFRVLIVDDHPLIRVGLTALLSRQPDLEVCGEATDVDDAIAQVVRLYPDLIILDISLKSGTGLDVIKRLRNGQVGNGRPDGAKILVHSMYEDSLYAERVLQAGAMGFVNKAESPDVLLAAARRILSGKVYLSPAMTERLLERAVGHRPQVGLDPTQQLTDRELQIFRMIGEAYSTRKIAKELFVSVSTVESHRANIKTKLGVKSAPELNQRAVQWVLENG
jgi:DNA-binding NarL/FixJ family response regulator